MAGEQLSKLLTSCHCQLTPTVLLILNASSVALHMTINKSSQEVLAWVIQDVRPQKDVTWLRMAVFPLHVLDLSCWTLQRHILNDLLMPAGNGGHLSKFPSWKAVSQQEAPHLCTVDVQVVQAVAKGLIIPICQARRAHTKSV